MAQISIRMDDKLREETDQILGELGLNMSSLLNIVARLVVRSHGIPFPLTLDERSQTVNRQEALRKMFEIVDARPNKPPEDYKFNRDECHDE